MKMRGTLLLPFVVGICWCCMAGVTDMSQERRDALNALVKRADDGDAKALYDLAYLHDTGYDTIPIDSARSTALYRMSAEKGYAPARNYLGYRYLNGEYIRQNIDSGLYWIAKAAGDGDVKAANNLGYLLSNSDIVSRDYPGAIRWLTQASNAGLPTAQSLLADLLRQGLGTSPDTVRAVELYTAAIEGGLQDAELKLLNMMAPKWLSLPSDSLTAIGKYYYTRRAPFIGVTLFEKGAEEGNVDAMALLGDAYSRAIGVEYDHDKSVDWFLRAALSGHPSAQFVIGELLEIFPDALTVPACLQVIEEFTHYNAGSDCMTGIVEIPDNNAGVGCLEVIENDAAGNTPAYLHSPQYWYDKAALGGVTDAESATRHLFGK